MLDHYYDSLPPDEAMRRAILMNKYDHFRDVLHHGDCSQKTLNYCLAFAAASEGRGNYSEALLKAGGDRQYYLDGRLDRAAAKGDLNKIDKWVGQGANVHHNNDQPLRAALFTRQENAAFYMVRLGCCFEKAVSSKDWQDAIKNLPYGRDILKLGMKLRADMLGLEKISWRPGY